MLMQSQWLNELRAVKRDLAYASHDVWRLATKRNQLSQTVNQTEIRFIGLRRSGNHAVLNWIFKQLQQPVYFINNVDAGMSPFRCFHLHFPDKGYRNEAWGNFSKKKHLIYSYEDYGLQDISNPYSEYKHDLWLGKTHHRYDILLLRDPFNLLASRLKKNYMDVKTSGESVVSLWISYAKEVLGETNLLKHNKIIINYNEWFRSLEYRQKIARQLGLDFSDQGFNYVSSYGGGSSFDERSFQGKAESMNVENRWHHFKDNDEFLSLIANEELLHYSKAIFGDVLETAKLGISG
ncbi:MAG: hypothetical protein AAGE59_19255 [Cyanobacteria bacterium P01_F01_bin.86]